MEGCERRYLSSEMPTTSYSNHMTCASVVLFGSVYVLYAGISVWLSIQGSTSTNEWSLLWSLCHSACSRITLFDQINTYIISILYYIVLPIQCFFSILLNQPKLWFWDAFSLFHTTYHIIQELRWKTIYIFIPSSIHEDNF